MTPIWLHFIVYAVGTLIVWPAFRVLDGLVTKVRARHGLAMAWGTAILGLVVILAGIGAISWIGVMLA